MRYGGGQRSPFEDRRVRPVAAARGARRRRPAPSGTSTTSRPSRRPARAGCPAGAAGGLAQTGRRGRGRGRGSSPRFSAPARRPRARTLPLAAGREQPGHPVAVHPQGLQHRGDRAALAADDGDARSAEQELVSAASSARCGSADLGLAELRERSTTPSAQVPGERRRRSARSARGGPAPPPGRTSAAPRPAARPARGPRRPAGVVVRARTRTTGCRPWRAAPAAPRRRAGVVQASAATNSRSRS